jgi:serine/threonine protein kinase
MKCPRCQADNPEETRYCGHCGLDLRKEGEDDAAATWTSQTPRRGLDRGTTFARRFEIIEEIGKGGMGTVYKAFDTKIKEIVALKILKPEIASDPEIIERFRNEIKLARKVAHRHVCRMYDLGEEGLSFFISMEFVAGEDLKSFIRRSGHLIELKTLGLARQISEGLAEAHRLGVVHRDLKPQNIMIDREGNAKIMDFGIARSLHARGITGTGVIIGTPEYMSPEQADARDVDSRADIYSFGAILYEMVTGRVPFDGDTPLSIVLQHKSTPAPDPRKINAQISPGLGTIILRCLEKEKGRRYQKMSEILEDLDRLENGLPTALRPSVQKKPLTTREITVKFSLKKILVPAAVVLVLISISALIYINRVASKETGEEAAPQAQLSAETKGRPVFRTPSLREETPGTKAVRSPISSFDMEAFFREASKYIGPDEAEKLKTGISIIKDKAARDQALTSIWGTVQDQIKATTSTTNSENPRDARRSYTRSASEMQKVLDLVNEKEKADEARREMEGAKKRSQAVLRTRGENLLSWIAGIKEKDADEAYGKDDFSGARILYGILQRVYQLSLRGGDEAQCLAALEELSSSAKAEAETAKAREKEEWLFNMAGEEEAKARQSLSSSRFAESAERFILAAFLYEKARDVALESGRPRTPASS